jgi:catechol 2,3-dioxygenase-like lactoylglutathione lyase family enzyme
MIRIGSIVLRVDDLQRQTEFWEAALGYVRRDSGESDDFVLLGPPDGAPEVWSVYGAERSQPVATGGRWDDLESGSDTRKPLPWVATSCPDPKMVRRGSTVRVRQRALQERRKPALVVSRELARSPACGGYGALYGALRFRTRAGSVGNGRDPRAHGLLVHHELGVHVDPDSLDAVIARKLQSFDQRSVLRHVVGCRTDRLRDLSHGDQTARSQERSNRRAAQ